MEAGRRGGRVAFGLLAVLGVRFRPAALKGHGATAAKARFWGDCLGKDKKADAEGFEPSTAGSVDRCSIQLSYASCRDRIL